MARPLSSVAITGAGMGGLASAAAGKYGFPDAHLRVCGLRQGRIPE